MKINSLLAATLAFVLVAGLGTPAFAETASGTGEVITPDEFPPSQVTQVDCGVDTGTIIAFDTSNGGGGGADHATLVTDLEAQGLTVREVDISTQGIPDCITKLFITSQAFNGCLTNPYSQTDEDLIVDWVSNGGELLLTGEGGPFCGPGTESLLERFVTDANIDDNANGPYVDGVDFDSTIPSTATLFSGVTSWQQFAGSTLVDALGSPDVVVSNQQGDAMVAGEFGKGCVVITGDSNWISDTAGHISAADNQQLALNSFLFLNECTEDVVGGEFLPIDSTALVLAGLQTSAIWMLPVLAGVAGSAFAVLYIKSRRN